MRIGRRPAEWDKLTAGPDGADPLDEIRECCVTEEHVRNIFRAADPKEAQTTLDTAIDWCSHPDAPPRADPARTHSAPLGRRDHHRRDHPHHQRTHRSHQRTHRSRQRPQQRRQTISTRVPQPAQLPAAHPPRRRPTTMPNSTRHTNQNAKSQLGRVEPGM